MGRSDHRLLNSIFVCIFAEEMNWIAIALDTSEFVKQINEVQGTNSNTIANVDSRVFFSKA